MGKNEQEQADPPECLAKTALQHQWGRRAGMTLIWIGKIRECLEGPIGANDVRIAPFDGAVRAPKCLGIDRPTALGGRGAPSMGFEMWNG